MSRVRLDDELVRQGLCRDRAEALRVLMAGDVSAGGERLTSPGMRVKPGLAIHVRGHIPYVGRGGLKLAGALDELAVDPAGLACLDVGCSTGGFTDCLLKRGASSVFAVDVGRAQFDWSLRNDPRVTLLERTNIVDVPAMGCAPVDLAVCDVSFTSVTVVLSAVLALLAPEGRFLTLVKPQFEAAMEQVGQGGVVRDPAVWAQVLNRVAASFAAEGLEPVSVCVSPITGAKGNHEFFLLGERVPAGGTGAVSDAVIESIERVCTL
ncbi:MAG: TlyA family RNA methyltransferase [Coriobacteriaceae bacterium]|nr:TlyA family RNA methyltransferase [Coriobacteriaceae bacterium]